MVPFIILLIGLPCFEKIGNGSSKKHVSRDVLFLYQYTFQMVHFVLDDFGSEALEPFSLFVEVFVLIFHFHPVIAPAGTLSGKGEAPFFRIIICEGMHGDDRIVEEKETFFIPDGDDGFGNADHIGCQAHAGVAVGGQGVQKIPARRTVLPAGLLGFPLEEEDIFDNGTNHENAPWVL
jgi:hypothetical protein